MKKKIILSLMFASGFSAIVYAQAVSFRLQHYDYYNFSAGILKPTISVYAKYQFSQKWAFTSYSLVNKGWAESLIGIEYAPWKWIYLEFEGGLEVDADSSRGTSKTKKILFRFAPMITVVAGPVTFLGIYEYGSINWFDTRLYFKIRNFNPGIMASRYYGAGPVMDYHFGKSPFYIWAAGLYEWETASYGIMAGIYVKFKADIKE